MNGTNLFPKAATMTRTATTSRKALHAALDTAQVALVAVFAIAGLLKLAIPNHALAQAMNLPGGLIVFIALAEVAAAIALEPMLSRVNPRVTIAAALGLMTVMVFAAMYHFSRGEVAMIPNNVVLGALAAFVAWGRAKERVAA